jgi:hypothetical protein
VEISRKSKMGREYLESVFPRLKKQKYSITSPETVEYNCIAWAADDYTRCWWPDAYENYYWPVEVPRIESIDYFIKAFETLGYLECDDFKDEIGYEKIAIYTDSGGKPTHAAKQVQNGLWKSKIGSAEDIEHEIDGLNGDAYGSIKVFMKRRIVS